MQDVLKKISLRQITDTHVIHNIQSLEKKTDYRCHLEEASYFLDTENKHDLKLVK